VLTIESARLQGTRARVRVPLQVGETAPGEARGGAGTP
jgi:hypothetical protein